MQEGKYKPLYPVGVLLKQMRLSALTVLTASDLLKNLLFRLFFCFPDTLCSIYDT